MFERYSREVSHDLYAGTELGKLSAG